MWIRIACGIDSKYVYTIKQPHPSLFLSSLTQRTSDNVAIFMAAVDFIRNLVSVYKASMFY